MVRRLLFTGGRDWPSTRHGWSVMYWGIRARTDPWSDAGIVVVHGDADGADQMVKYIAGRMGWATEPYPASRFPSPRARNQRMVDLGADECVACATSWASGTGMCARMARRAGIVVTDLGVDTRIEVRPSFV